MQARKTASQYAHPFIAATLIGCTFAFTATLAQAQVPASAERDAAQQRRAQERETQVREQQQRSPDVRLPSPSATVAERLPEAQTPCFTIHQLELRGQDAERFDWLQGALADPEGRDSPLGQCLGANGIKLVLQRAQDALVARGFVTSRVLAQPQDLSSGKLALTVLAGASGPSA